MDTKQDVQLYFADEGLPSSAEYISKGVNEKFKGFSTSIDKIIDWFDIGKLNSS